MGCIEQKSYRDGQSLVASFAEQGLFYTLYGEFVFTESLKSRPDLLRAIVFYVKTSLRSPII